eukprot:5158033-Prymnesium_polylepis.1
MTVLCKSKIGVRKCESAKLQYKFCSVRFDAVRCGSMRFRAVSYERMAVGGGTDVAVPGRSG